MNLYGQITAIDAETLTIIVKVETPDRYLGDSITVQVNPATILKFCEDGTSYRVDFDDFDEEMYVRASGTLLGDVLTAVKVIGYP